MLYDYGVSAGLPFEAVLDVVDMVQVSSKLTGLCLQKKPGGSLHTNNGEERGISMIARTLDNTFAKCQTQPLQDMGHEGQCASLSFVGLSWPGRLG